MQRHAHVERHRGIQAHGLVDGVLEVGHILQILVRRRAVRAQALQDLTAQLRDGVGVTAELENGEGQGAGGGVAAGEQDGDELVADDFAIAGVGGQGVAEGVALCGFGLLVEFGLVKAEDALDVGVDKGVDDFEAGAELAAGKKLDDEGAGGLLEGGGMGRDGVGLPSAGEHVLETLDFTKGGCEFGVWVIQAVDTLAEEELGGRVKGESAWWSGQ